MAYETRDMSGTLFVNDRKEKENHPDYKGNVVINGVEMWVSGWKKASRDGSKKYLSLSFKPKEEARSYNERQRAAQPAPKNLEENADPGFSDDIPF
jgi:uncharacterized protein (DUF736 family)